MISVSLFNRFGDLHWPNCIIGKEHAAHREEARELMRHVQEKCSEIDPERKVRLHTLAMTYTDIAISSQLLSSL